MNITLLTQGHCKHSSNPWHRYLRVQQARGIGLLWMQFERRGLHGKRLAERIMSCTRQRISHLPKLWGFVCCCTLFLGSLSPTTPEHFQLFPGNSRLAQCLTQQRKNATQQIPRNSLTSDTICNARSTATQTAPYSESSTSKSAPLPCSTRSAQHRNQTHKLSCFGSWQPSSSCFSDTENSISTYSVSR